MVRGGGGGDDDDGGGCGGGGYDCVTDVVTHAVFVVDDRVEKTVMTTS